MEQTERLSVQSRNYHICCLHYHLVCIEFRHRWNGRRPGQQFRRIYRKISSTRSCPCGPWHVADRRSAHIGNFGKRSRCFQFRRFIRSNECQFPGRNADDYTKHPKRQSRFRAVKRFQPYDFLSALRSLHRDGSYYKKRKRLMEIYIRNGEQFFFMYTVVRLIEALSWMLRCRYRCLR